MPEPPSRAGLMPLMAITRAVTLATFGFLPTVAVLGADTRTAQYEAAVAAQLRDPESTRFRSVHLVRFHGKSPVICGELNTKNGFGGYTGFMPFAADIAMNYGTVVMAIVWLPKPVGDHLLESVERHCAGQD